MTAGLASDVLGQFDRAKDEWAEAYQLATTLGADRELCVGAFLAGSACSGSTSRLGSG